MPDRRGERRPPHRRGVLRRDPVPANWTAAEDFIDGPESPDEPDDGSAGVREPRRPLSLPMSGAGVTPEPEPFLVAALPDPRS